MSENNNQTGKLFISRAGWYSLRYPTEWAVTEDDICVEICDREQGVGALHLSAYQTPAPVDPREELLEALVDHEPPATAEDITLAVDATRRIASFESVENLSFEKTWYVSEKSHLFVVTYNCADENKGKELEIVENIIRSIELEAKSLRN